MTHTDEETTKMMIAVIIFIAIVLACWSADQKPRKPKR